MISISIDVSVFSTIGFNLLVREMTKLFIPIVSKDLIPIIKSYDSAQTTATNKIHRTSSSYNICVYRQDIN